MGRRFGRRRRAGARPRLFQGRLWGHPRKDRRLAMSELRLIETVHPTKEGLKDFQALMGIDAIKDVAGR